MGITLGEINSKILGMYTELAVKHDISEEDMIKSSCVISAAIMAKAEVKKVSTPYGVLFFRNHNANSRPPTKQVENKQDSHPSTDTERVK